MPARIVSGWVCYMWDMHKKMIHVLDPANPIGLDNERCAYHADVTKLLHKALADCISEFFDDWSIPVEPWTRTFPVLGNLECDEYVSQIF